MSEAQTSAEPMTDEVLALFRDELRGWSLMRPLSIKQENEVLGRVRWGYDDMARILAPLMEPSRALRESHAELLAAAKRAYRWRDGDPPYDIWAVLRAAIEKAEAINA